MPSITLGPHTLSVPDTYTAGPRTLTPAEAAVLNSARRRALHGRLERIIDNIPAGSEQEVLNEIAATFAFGIPSPVRTGEALDRAAWRMASDLAGEELRRRGRARGDLSEEAYKALVTRIASTPNVRAEAERRLQASREIAEDVLDLGDF